MYLVHNEKWGNTYNGRKTTAKSRKNQETWREEKLHILGKTKADNIKQRWKKV